MARDNKQPPGAAPSLATCALLPPPPAPQRPPWPLCKMGLSVCPFCRLKSVQTEHSVIDPNKPMHVTFAFSLDMTEIEVYKKTASTFGHDRMKPNTYCKDTKFDIYPFFSVEENPVKI